MAGYRPADWHVLDLERDPTPGDPVRVKSLAKSLRDFADDVFEHFPRTQLEGLNMHVEQEHIRSWLAGREYWIVGKEVSDGFNEFLSKFPWTTSRLMWGEVSHTSLELPEGEDWEDFFTGFSPLPAGRHDFMFVMYSWREPGIVCRTADALKGIDCLYSSAPGPRYFCGADVVGDSPRPVYEDFAEYDGGDEITAYVH